MCTTCLCTGTDCIYGSARSVARAENLDLRRQLDAVDPDQRKLKISLPRLVLLSCWAVFGALPTCQLSWPRQGMGPVS
jgi:hypothetical protein